MNQFFVVIGNMLRRYSVGQRLVIMTIFLGMISAIISLILWANRPEFTVLYSNIDPSSAGKIVSGLREIKVKYKIENNGRTILVPADNVADLKLKFAEEGYASQAVAGYEIFDNANIGMTTFMQRLNMRRALEGELTKTINQFPGVKNSRVHLVLPEGRLFEEKRTGSASVVVYLHSGRYLAKDQVKGIAALVANSVKGINPEGVVVVDAEGKLLSDNRSDDRVLGSAGNQWELRHTIETKIRNKVTDIIEGIVGYQNTVVEVSTDLDFRQLERTMETYDPENVVIVSEERHSESSSNIDTSVGANENYANENVITNYELNKTVERFVDHTGTIKRISIAVLINGSYRKTKNDNGEEITEYIPRSNKELTQIAALVKSAIGFDQERGDIVEVQNLQFDNSNFDTDKEYFIRAEKQALWAGVINKGIVGIGILIAFFLLKTLFKNAGVALQLPAGGPISPGLAKVKAAIPQLQEVEEENEISEDIYSKKLSPEARAKLKAKDKMTNDVVSYAKEKPEDTAKLIRSWLTSSV